MAGHKKMTQKHPKSIQKASKKHPKASKSIQKASKKHPKSIQKASKKHPKASKSIQKASKKHPKSIQKASKKHPKASKSIQKASKKHPKSIQKASKSIQKHPKSIQKASKKHPKASKSIQKASKKHPKSIQKASKSIQKHPKSIQKLMQLWFGKLDHVGPIPLRPGKIQGLQDSKPSWGQPWPTTRPTLFSYWRLGVSKRGKCVGVDAIELWMCVVYQNIPWGFACATKDAGIPWQNTWHTHDSVSIGHALTRHQGVSWCRPHSTKRPLGKDGDFQWLSWGRVEYPTDTPANVGETINDNCAADLGRLNLRVFVGVLQKWLEHWFVLIP